MKRVAYLAITLGLCAAGACAQVKPVIRSAVDIARDLCALVSSERYGISAQDAARMFCATEAQLDPWLQEILAAEQRAAAKAKGATP